MAGASSEDELLVSSRQRPTKVVQRLLGNILVLGPKTKRARS